MSGHQPNAITRAVSHAWERWKAVARVIGTVQARLLLAVFYFTVVPPFAVIAKMKDPLGLRRRDRARGWVERPAADVSFESARRQF